MTWQTDINTRYIWETEEMGNIIVQFNYYYGTERTMDLFSEERRNQKEHRMLLDIYQLKP